MKHRALRQIGLSLALLLLSVPAIAAQQASPQDTAIQFYNAYIKLKPRGLPNKQQRRVLWPMITSDLRKLFVAAQQEQTKFARQHPDQKPPWADGDLLSSLFEGASAYKLGEATVNEGHAEVLVHLTYTDSSGTSQWTDTLLLTRSRNVWQVSDIIFKGEWQFKTGSSLRRVLQAR